MCVVSDSGEEVAALSIKVSQSLQELSDFQRLRFEALIPIQENESQDISSRGKESSQNARIDINIYGQRETSERIASELGHAGLFLQDPHWSPANIPYENPQYLELPDCASEEETSFQNLYTEQENVTIHDLPLDSFELDLDLLLDSLLYPQDLTQAKADQRVRTPLEEYASSHSSYDLLRLTLLISKRHQTKGLDFIMKRERTSPIYPPSLWKAEDTETGQIR